MNIMCAYIVILAWVGHFVGDKWLLQVQQVQQLDHILDIQVTVSALTVTPHSFILQLVQVNSSKKAPVPVTVLCAQQGWQE